MEQLQQTITTLEIAEMLDIKHWQILRKLEGTKSTKGVIQILNDNKIVAVDYFIKSSYTDEKGEQRPCYKVTKMGCDFLANKFSGEKGIVFTARYVKRFHDMEEAIKQAQLEQTEQQKQTKVPWTMSTTLVPLISDWSSRNLPKVKEICEVIGHKSTQAFVMYELYQRLGMVYNLEVAKRIYQEETKAIGSIQSLALIEYFPQLQEEAEKILDEMLAERSIKKYKWN